MRHRTRVVIFPSAWTRNRVTGSSSSACDAILVAVWLDPAMFAFVSQSASFRYHLPSQVRDGRLATIYDVLLSSKSNRQVYPSQQLPASDRARISHKDSHRGDTLPHSELFDLPCEILTSPLLTLRVSMSSREMRVRIAKRNLLIRR